MAYLGPLSIILVLAGEGSVLEPIKHLWYPLGGVRQHGLEGDGGGQATVVGKILEAVVEEGWNQGVVGRHLTRWWKEKINSQIKV